MAINLMSHNNSSLTNLQNKSFGKPRQFRNRSRVNQSAIASTEQSIGHIQSAVKVQNRQAVNKSQVFDNEHALLSSTNSNSHSINKRDVLSTKMVQSTKNESRIDKLNQHIEQIRSSYNDKPQWLAANSNNRQSKENLQAYSDKFS
jgi:hypothetical protein